MSYMSMLVIVMPDMPYLLLLLCRLRHCINATVQHVQVVQALNFSLYSMSRLYSVLQLLQQTQFTRLVLFFSTNFKHIRVNVPIKLSHLCWWHVKFGIEPKCTVCLPTGDPYWISSRCKRQVG